MFCLLVALSSNAQATPPPDFNWTGFFIGGNLGGAIHNYDFGDNRSKVNIQQQFYNNVDVVALGEGENPFTSFRTPGRSDHNGNVVGGGQGGYNFQVGHFVFGVEGEFDRTASSGHNTEVGLGENSFFAATPDGTNEPIGETITADTTFDSTRQSEQKWQGAGMFRLGFAQGPFLFYAIGGIAFAGVDTWTTDFARTDFFTNQQPGVTPTIATGVDRPPITPRQGQGSSFLATVGNTNQFKNEDTFVGYTAGGGIEFAFSPVVSLALEYRHSDYGDENSSNGRKGPIHSGGSSVDLTSDQVTFKMNVLLSPLFGGGTYANNKLAAPNPFLGHNLLMGYAGRHGDGKEMMSGKDKSVAVVPAEEFNWSGLYIGVHGGGEWTDFEFRGFDSDVDIDQQFFGTNPGARSLVPFTTPKLDSLSDNSLQGGGQIGYNFQFGHWVFGVEGDFSGVSTDAQRRFVETNFGFVDFAPFTGVTTLTTTEEVSKMWDASARGRIGWAHGPLLLYATGGAAFADIQTRAKLNASTDFLLFGVFPGGNTTTEVAGESENVEVGWTAGGGAEWAYHNLFTIGLEYRHSDFGSTGTGFKTRARDAIFSSSARADVDSDQLTLRVNVLLGHVHTP
jgi:outer membrane immunogenic protein